MSRSWVVAATCVDRTYCHPRQLLPAVPNMGSGGPAGGRQDGFGTRPAHAVLPQVMTEGGWWMSEESTPEGVGHSPPVSSGPVSGEDVPKTRQADGSEEEDPDALLVRWMSQIRDAERRAERETAAIRLR